MTKKKELVVPQVADDAMRNLIKRFADLSSQGVTNENQGEAITLSIMGNQEFLQRCSAVREGDEFTLPRLTFLVGDNGAGKSTFINAVVSSFYGRPPFNSAVALRVPKEFRVLHLDTEMGNPRFRHLLDGSGVPDLASEFVSHGQSMLPLLERVSKKTTKPTLFIIDEPEAGLSPASQVHLLRWINEAINNGNSCIVATHSVLLISSNTGAVLDLDSHPAKLVPAEEARDYYFGRLLYDLDRPLKNLEASRARVHSFGVRDAEVNDDAVPTGDRV